VPDHGDLLANLVRWAAKDAIPLEIRGGCSTVTCTASRAG